MPSISRKDLLNLLYNAEYYISTSQIENSSNAVLEGLLLSKNIILSNIPSHNEMLRNWKTKTITLNNIEFHVLKDIDNNKIEAMSWIEVFKKMFDIINNFKKSSDLSKKY